MDNGWDFATYRGMEGEWHILYFASTRLKYRYALSLELYGQSNVGVVIAKEGT